jgi:vacuolar-type H+-ATPase subunit I/STV1
VQQRSPAQKCAVALGVLLVAAGIVGFFYNGTFTSNERVHDDLLGAFSVNGWSNTLHTLLGIWGLAVASSWSSARNYGYAAGLLLVALGVWGFILGAGQSILSIVPVNAAVDWARVVLGVIAVLSAVATSPEPEPTTARVAS